MPDPSPAVRIRGLTKAYDGRIAVRDLSLEVRRGEILGFLGPNGAGKTTTLRCLVDAIRPTTGQVEALGLDAQRESVEVRRRIGYLPGELHLDDSLTGRGLLRTLDAMRGGAADWPLVESLAERLEVDLRRRIKNLSKGNKRKLGVIQALMHRPPLLVLDEPTSGLDPLIQREVLRMVGEARDGGASVFFSSHILSEVQAIADRVALIREGTLVEVVPVRDLLERGVRRVVVELQLPLDEPPWHRLAGVEVIRAEGRQLWELQVAGDLNPLLQELARHAVRDVRIAQATLEETFLRYYRGDS